MAGVQIIGKAAIVETFNECECETFAILSGKTFIVGSGINDLTTWIDRFCPPGVSGSFTLQTYDCAVEEVRKNTECCSSFNCRITEMYGGAGMGGFQSTLTKRIEDLEKQKKPEEDDRMTDALMGWLEDPEKLIQVIGAVRGLFGMGAPAQAVPVTMGGMTPKIISPGELTQTEEARYRRLAASLDDLEKNDPHIVEHLEKLANISRTKPDTFKMLISMLGSY